MNYIQSKKRLLEIKRDILQGKFTNKLYKELLRLDEDLRKQLPENNRYNEEYNKYYSEFGKAFRDLKDKIYCEGYLNKYTKEEVEAINNNSFILPLCIASCNASDVTLSGDNRYMFMCPFHEDEDSSLAIFDIYNYYKCYSDNCGIRGSSLRFIEDYEGLKLRDAADLLCRIFLLKVKHAKGGHEDLVEKYQKAILSDRYKDLLMAGKERLLKRKEQLERDHAYSRFFERVDIKAVYDERFNTINRIENGIYIEPHPELKLR